MRERYRRRFHLLWTSREIEQDSAVSDGTRVIQTDPGYTFGTALSLETGLGRYAESIVENIQEVIADDKTRELFKMV